MPDSLGLDMYSSVLADYLAISPFVPEGRLPWTAEAVMNTKNISDVQISPDNSKALFVGTENRIGEEKGESFSRIYITKFSDGTKAVPFLPESVFSLQPRWSFDGKWIAYIARIDGIRKLFAIPSEGGDPISLIDSKTDVQTFAWSPNGSEIAFAMADDTEVERSRKKTSMAMEYGRSSYINRLWIIDVESPLNLPKPLTNDLYCVRGLGDFGSSVTEFDWSPDAKKIVFAHSPSLGFDHYYLESSLAVVDLSSLNVAPLQNQSRFEAVPRFSPDGKWIAYITDNSKEKYVCNRRLAIRSASTGEECVLSETWNGAPYLVGPSLLGWSADAKNLIFFEPKETKYHLVLVPVDGGIAREVNTIGIYFKEPVLSPDRTMLGFVAQSPDIPPEAFVSCLDDFKPTVVSSLNASQNRYSRIRTETISWNAPDGMKIEGLITYPADFQEGKRYPLLLMIHGGPMGFFDESFVGSPYPYSVALFAEEGFLVLRPNPRGSTGYGKNFRSANYTDWGGLDLVDLLSGVDFMIEKGIADGDRLGVMGWSYGGYMTASIIAKTNRFKAASAGAGIYNLVSFHGTADIRRFVSDYLGEFPFFRDLYEIRSPINFVQNMKTPCLIQHGTEDKRVPVSQSLELYHALERVGQNPSLLLYPKMGHHLAEPNMMLDAMKCNLEWFKGKI